MIARIQISVVDQIVESLEQLADVLAHLANGNYFIDIVEVPENKIENDRGHRAIDVQN